MSDFHTEETIKSVRKPHVCEQCGRTINVGETAIKGSGSWDGYMYAHYQHPECQAAGLAYAKEADLWDEEYVWFQHVDLDEYDLKPWLLDNHPIVAGRLNLEREEVDA